MGEGLKRWGREKGQRGGEEGEGGGEEGEVGGEEREREREGKTDWEGTFKEARAWKFY